MNCNKIDCPSLADFKVQLLFFRKDFPHPCIADVGLFVCSAHMKDLTLSSVLTDENWKVLVRGFEKNNLKIPDRELTQLWFKGVDLNGEEIELKEDLEN